MIYRFIDDYQWLSNFYLVEIYNGFDNNFYPSVEHAYQSMKSNLPEWKEFCQSKEIHPGLVKKKAKDILIIEDWNEKKVNYMRLLVENKFGYWNKELYFKLIDTGTQNIVEGNYHNDKFWGVDLKENPNIGENHLGRIIMEIRTNLIR